MGHPAQLTIAYSRTEGTGLGATRRIVVDLPDGPGTVSTPDFIIRVEEDAFAHGSRGSHARVDATITQRPAHSANLPAKAAVKSEAITLTITPLRALSVESVSARYRISTKRFTRILCNGYQSWTDTVERPLDYTMRGLHGVPRGLVDYYVLDGGGDYRFTTYPNRPGAQHGWTYVYLRNDTECLFIGSLDETRGFTLLRFDTMAETLSIQPEAPLHPLAAHEPHVLGRWTFVRSKATTDASDAGQGTAAEAFTGAPADAAIDTAFERWCKLADIEPRPCLPLTGYSSWYRHYGTITQTKLLADLKGAKKAFSKLDTHDYQRVFQIDDGYALVGDWLEPNKESFPQGMAALASAITDAGFTPGLWAAPFVCEKNSHLAAEHPDWLLRDEAGNPVAAGSHWSGSLALDTRNMDVRAYVTRVISTMVHEWGFRVLKLDFLYAACLLPHDGMNRGQLMADAMALLRTAAGDSAEILGCGVPLGSAFGVVEHCRIGCDVGLDWDDKPPMRLLHRERVSTKNSLANTVYRAPLNGRVFYNDPDVVFLRTTVSLSKAQRALLLDGDACFGGALLSSDDMGAWNDEQLHLFQTALDMQRIAQQ